MSEPQFLVSAKTINCNGTNVEIRPLGEGDHNSLHAFGAALSADDTLYLEDDYHSAELITRLVNASWAENWRQVVAITNDQIVGYSAVRRLPGWSSHVGDVQLIIRPDWRRLGLGTVLAQAIFETARHLGVDKVIVKILDTQVGGRGIFERLGCHVEGVLRDHAVDRQGKRHNLLVLAYHIHPQTTNV